MTDIAPAAPAADTSAAPAPAAPTSTVSESSANTGTDTQASQDTGGAPASPDLPPGWSRRADGKWAWKGVVDGQEVELDQERAEHFLRTKESGQRRWQEAARAKQEAEAEREELRQHLLGLRNPQGIRQLAVELGMSPREVAEQILAAEMEEAALTPEQRELRDLRARDAEYKRAQQQQELRAREQQIRQHEQQFVQRLTTSATTALDRVGAPANPQGRQWMTRRIAELYVDHKQNGQGDTTIDDLAKRAAADYRDLASGAYGDDDLVERVWSNEALREKLRARYLEAAKPPHPSREQPKPGPDDLPPRGTDGRFRKERLNLSGRPSDLTEQLNRLMERKR